MVIDKSKTEPASIKKTAFKTQHQSGFRIHSSVNTFPTKYQVASLTHVLHAVRRDGLGTEIQMLVGPMDAMPEINSSPERG